MDYLKEYPDLKKLLKIFSEISGKRVLIFSHDDPDGLTAGAILEKILEKSGARVQMVLLPTYELSRQELLDNYQQQDLVIIADKGTIGYYDDYLEIVSNLIIIDHHPPQNGQIKKALVFNPAVKEYQQTATAHLANIIAEQLGLVDEQIDFLTLVGLKGDWAIEPATDFVAPFVTEFYNRVAGKFPKMLARIKDRPTMFEVRQRENTTVLNQIGEFFFALSGGGFQYFYNERISELKNVSQVDFAYKLLRSCPGKDYGSFAEFRQTIPEKDLAEKIYQCYRQDWEKVSHLFDFVVTIGKKEETECYLFVGRNVPLMPMVGSVKLAELGEDGVALIMVNQEKNGGLHFSFRGKGNKLHLGKLASELAENLIERYGQRGVISGGGHPVAAECKTRTAGVNFSDGLRIFLNLFDKKQ